MTALYWSLTVVNAALVAVGSWHVTGWVLRRIDTRRRHREPTDPVVGHWPCPDCGVQVPITATTQRVRVARLDPTDIEAHKLTHQEQQ